jgi:cytosine/adenosine deaminase-related metal-dependent hydrolase
VAFLGIFSRMALSPTYSLHARYLFPIDLPPIRDGWITVSHGRIVSLGHEPTGERRDLGDVAILPAFINAHTHLEFSNLAQPLGRPGTPFTEWIREVVRWRRAAIEQPAGTDWRADAIRKGIEESLRGGVVSLGEIATLPQTEGDGRYDAMQGVSFLEVLGLADERHDELLSAAKAYLATWHSSGRHPLAGLSPHAPYTVGPRLVSSIAALAAEALAPVAMHLAETREELELLRAGTGPFRELLDDLGAWQTGVIPLGSTPLDYLRLLANTDRSLIIHGNYLSHEEIEFAGRQHDRMSVIYCPRTHAYFAHDRYPLAEMLARDVNVALGTDSRASNPDLNMLSELHFVAEHHQDVSPEAILRLATSNAAKALGMGETHGTLASGKRADLAVVSVAADRSPDPHELLFDTRQTVRFVFRGGRQLFPASDC